MLITNLPEALASPRPAHACLAAAKASGFPAVNSPAEELGWEVAGCPCRQCRHCPWLCTSCWGWQQLTWLSGAFLLA